MEAMIRNCREYCQRKYPQYSWGVYEHLEYDIVVIYVQKPNEAKGLPPYAEMRVNLKTIDSHWWIENVDMMAGYMEYFPYDD